MHLPLKIVDHCTFTSHHYQAVSIKLGSFSLQLLVIYNYYTWCHINLHFTIKFDGHVGKSHPTVILCDTNFKCSLYVWFIKAGEDSSSIAWRQFGGCKPSAKQQQTKCSENNSNEMQQLRFILRKCFTLHVSGDNPTHHWEYMCCIWPQISRHTWLANLFVVK